MEQFRLAFRDTSPVESKQIMCVWNIGLSPLIVTI